MKYLAILMLFVCGSTLSFYAMGQDSGGDESSEGSSPSEDGLSVGGSDDSSTSSDGTASSLADSLGVSQDSLNAMNAVAESVQGQVTELSDAIDTAVTSGLISQDDIGFLTSLAMEPGITQDELDEAMDAVVAGIISSITSNSLTQDQQAALNSLAMAVAHSVIGISNALNANNVSVEDMSAVLASILSSPTIQGEPGSFPGLPGVDAGGTGLAVELILVDLDPRALRPTGYVPSTIARFLGGSLTLNQGQSVAGHEAYLKLNSTGNLVLYNERNRALWSSGTAGKLSTTVRGFAKFDSKGVLGIYSEMKMPMGMSSILWPLWMAHGGGAVPSEELRLSAEPPFVTITNSNRQVFYSSDKVAYLDSNELYLKAGQALNTPAFQLVFRTDGNLVLNTPSRSRVWSTLLPARSCTPSTCHAAFASDGNLSLYQDGRRVWSTRLATKTGRRLRLSGKYPYVSVLNANGAFAWWQRPAASPSLHGEGP